MKTIYNSPIILVKALEQLDVITASVQDDAEGFDLGWIAD